MLYHTWLLKNPGQEWRNRTWIIARLAASLWEATSPESCLFLQRFFYQGQHDISEGLNVVVTKPRISLSARSNASGSAVLPYRKEIAIIMGRDRAIKSSKIVIIGLSRDGMMWASKHNSIYMYMYGISDMPRERYILSAILI